MSKSRMDIAQLWQGMSQQPPWRRNQGQVDLAQNVRLDPLEGARKRNSTYIHAELGLPGTGTLPYVVTMRQFYLFIYPTGIVAYDRDLGGNIPINNPQGWSYLATSTIDSIDTTTAIDTIVILNRNVRPNTRHSPDYTLKGTVNIYRELPTTGVSAGDVYKVLDTDNYDPPGQYMYIDPTNPTVPAGFVLDPNLSGNWMRVPAPFDPSARYVGSTMPHRLYFDADAGQYGEFTFEEIPWVDRLSGNNATNPKMPWVRDGLNSVCFHQGRLFLIGNTSVTAGGSSPNQNIFNLYVDNINGAVKDSDPIALDINLPNIGRPQRSLPIGGDLLISCENGQLAFSTNSGTPFTPSNGQYRQVGNFRALDIPLASNGSEVALIDEFSRIQLFGLSQTSTIQYVTYYGSLSDHVPTLLMNDTIRRLHLIDTTLFVTTASNTVWVHERFRQGNEIIQLAWEKSVFYEPTYYMDNWKNQIYILSKGPFLCINRYQHVKNTDDQQDFLPRLDRLQAAALAAPFASYDHGTNLTRVNFYQRDPMLTNAFLVTPFGGFLRPTSVDGNNAFFEGNWMGLHCQWGFSFEAIMDLSDIYPASDVRPTLSRIVLLMKDTSNFTLTINNPDRTIRTVDWNSPATTGYTLGLGLMGYTGYAKFPAQGDARTTTIRISNNTPGTFTLSAVEYYLQQGSN